MIQQNEEEELHNAMDISEGGVVNEDNDSNDDSSSMMDDEEEDSMIAIGSSSSTTLPLAREHSYLPGVCHPLSVFPVASEGKKASFQKIKDDEEELAILDLKDIFLFPGGTLPLRLRNPKWIEYLGTKIDAARGIIPATAGDNLNHDKNRSIVRIGVVTNIQKERREQESTSSESKEDEWIGRIGTFATIMYTHEEQNNNNDASLSVWQRHDDTSRQLIVTAFGTGRFQIISHVPNNTRDSDHNHNNNHFLRRLNENVRLCFVRDLQDTNIINSPKRLCQKRVFNTTSIETKDDNETKTANYDEEYQNNVMKHLSLVTPIPFHVYQSVWPWKLVQDIRMELTNKHNLHDSSHKKSLSGFQKSLPNDDDSMDPCAFSFWMAANMPLLTNQDRMELLTLDNVILRLKRILQIVREIIQEEEQQQKPIRCIVCGNPITFINSLFQVSGAEGTTGAYVNEHGVIHQTMTVRDVLDHSMLYIGESETRDSWFPGYAWTIACCRYCRSHLGWKFDKVVNEVNDDKDRPQIFWGMSASNITTNMNTSFPLDFLRRAIDNNGIEIIALDTSSSDDNDHDDMDSSIDGHVL